MSGRRFGWRAVAYVVVLAAGAAFVVTRWSELVAIWRGHGPTFAAVTAVMALAIVVQARNFCSFLSAAQRPRLAVMSQIWALGALANYLGPFQPGLALRVALLTRLGTSVKDSSLATARQIFASLWLGLLVASVSLLGVNPVALAIPAVGLLVAFAALSKVLPLVRSVAASTLRRTRAGHLAPHLELAISLPTLRSAIGVLMQYVLSGAVFFLGYREFGVDITVAAALGLACVIYASSIVALFPGNVGVLEALLTVFGKLNELPVDQALALALLFRGAQITGALLLAAALIPFRWDAARK